MSLNQDTSVLNKFLKNIENRVSLFTTGRYWLIKITLVSLLFNAFLLLITNPNIIWTYKVFIESQKTHNYFEAPQTVKKQADTFFEDLGMAHFNESTYESTSHTDKLRYRLFLPLIVAVFKIENPSLSLWLIQIGLLFIFANMVGHFTYKLLNDRVCTFYFLLGFFSLYPAFAFVLDMFAYGDAIAYLLLFATIYFRQPLFVAVCLQVAFWTDERALLNVGFIIVWYLLIPLTSKRRIITIGSIISSGLIYVLIRHLISSSLHVETINKLYFQEFLSTYLENMKFIGFRIWCGFEGYWLLFFLSIVLLIYNRQYLYSCLFGGMIILSINLSFIVYDVNRAISYGFIGMFISIYILKQYINIKELRILLVIILIISSLFPLANHLRLTGGYTLM